MSSSSQASDNNAPPPALPETLVQEARNTFEHRGSNSISSESIELGGSRASLPDEHSKKDFGFHIHKYISDYIHLADQKAAFVFAFDAGLLGFGFHIKLHQMWLKSLNTWMGIDVFCFLSTVMLVVGIVFSWLVVVPNLRKSHRGYIFFGSISEYESSTVYSSEILGTPSIKLSQAVLQHAYDISKVCTSKYWKLGMAMWFSFGGVIIFTLLMLLRA